MSSEYKFRYKRGLYLVRVSPDIAVRGGQNGKGTMTYLNPICADGVTVMAECRGYQGRHSKAGMIRVMIPGAAAGRTERLTICQRLAPRA